MNLLGKNRGKYCYNGGKQHNFEPRYDEVPNPNLYKANGTNLHELMYYDVYVKDVCI